MAKVDVDIDSINKDLVPISSTLVSNIKSVQSNATGIDFPDSDYNCSNIVSKIDDCVDNSEKYEKWVNSLGESYNKAFTDGVESISSNKVEEVQKVSIVVK